MLCRRERELAECWWLRVEAVVLDRMTPNPSIEGMPKRLRLLVTPHVKR